MNAAEVITQVHAREVLDSRGNPTVEAEVCCAGGFRGRAIVPSGASTGRHEAVELRDGEPARYGGRGVRQAVANVRQEIGPHLVGTAVGEQRAIDAKLMALDGTPNKSRLGANATLAVSLACAHAAANGRNEPLWRYLANSATPRLPLPMINLISGGLHAGGNLPVQDFLLLPVGAQSFSEALAMAVAVYRELAEELLNEGYEGALVGDEGGFGPRLRSNEEAIEIILRSIESAGLRPGAQAALAIDVAATHFYKNGRYHLERGAGPLTGEGLIEVLGRWARDYPVWSIEDGLAEDDWDAWRLLTKALGQRVQLVGDDLFVTSAERLRRGIAEGVANSVLIKPNQAGTLTETLDVLALARSAGYRPVVSARSGETEDTTIADLAVATAAGQIKIGSVARSERLAKYNQLLRIEEDLGAGAFSPWSRPGGTT